MTVAFLSLLLLIFPAFPPHLSCLFLSLPNNLCPHLLPQVKRLPSKWNPAKCPSAVCLCRASWQSHPPHVHPAALSCTLPHWGNPGSLRACSYFPGPWAVKCPLQWPRKGIGHRLTPRRSERVPENKITREIKTNNGLFYLSNAHLAIFRMSNNYWASEPQEWPWRKLWEAWGKFVHVGFERSGGKPFACHYLSCEISEGIDNCISRSFSLKSLASQGLVLSFLTNKRAFRAFSKKPASWSMHVSYRKSGR